ncbi:hypothetical protein EFL99_13450 [Lactococcus lactis]|uniref:YopX family protein n=1 Tax=Lactococcus lactis TaxID=1358 RepID=UPI00223B19E8|nr:YopX family protein [Lactococcus lactis]MCT1184185.1 hypothetical protein [Lactococcus lactis]
MIPKLRAWDKQDERMRTVSSINFAHEVISCKFAELKPFDLVDEFSIDDVILMQSTGLKDKNGVEIFEGDIVNYVKSFTNPMTGSGSLSINKNLRIIFKDAEFTADGIDIRLKKIVSHMEIIGNIYENPELLEGEDR